MNIPDISKSKTVRVAIIGICVIIVALVIFQAGLYVGYRKALYAEKMADEFSHTFGNRKDLPDVIGGSISGHDVPGGHGAFGTVVQVNGSFFVVADSNNTEKEVVTASSTIIRKLRDNATIADIKVDDLVAVIGVPNDQGQIEAKLIRILPPDSSAPSGQATSTGGSNSGASGLHTMQNNNMPNMPVGMPMPPPSQGN